MPHRTEPRRLLVPYGFLVIAGALLTLYQPPSVQALTSEPLVVVWHVVLLAGAVLALGASAFRREVLEMVGGVLVCGPLVAYVVILWAAGYAASDAHGGYATWAIAALFLSLASLIAGRAAWIWSQVRAARRNGRQPWT